MKRPIDSLLGETLKQDIYIYIRTHFCCSASECTFNYEREDRPLDVHHSWLRALLGPLAPESKSIHLASAVGLSRQCLSCVIGVYLPRSCRWRAPWCGGFQYPFNREIMWWTTNIGSIRSIHQWDVCDSFEVHKEKLMENKQKKRCLWPFSSGFGCLIWDGSPISNRLQNSGQ